MVNWMVGGILALAFGLAVWKIRRDKKRKLCGCGMNCGACQGAFPQDCQGGCGEQAKD